MLRPPALRSAALAATTVALAALTACSAGPSASVAAPNASTASAAATAAALAYSTDVVGADGGPLRPVSGAGTLGPGFVPTAVPPAPGDTLTPKAGSWSAVHPPAGYRVALVSSDESAQVRRLRGLVERWADAHDVEVSDIAAHDPKNYLAPLQRAIDLKPDLVITVGPALADPMALVTSGSLDQKFLVVGAELAEPTYNVGATLWQADSYRGGASDEPAAYDPRLFTAARITRAIEAGVASILTGYSGYVIRVR